ncbi:MAG TPA: Cache 3/Cache 2 fusion domain-containing protein, partial [Rhodocyclaceae bacterium]|nr:Cache 3/Cache 2 fusion domain-containing protein [Rhodocyclaceae bacterium]
MKNNQPVTNVEVPLTADTMIVSKTDLKGQITYVNKDFLEISGFSESELIGQAHNIVRHPDMPPAAFKDLWDTVKDGRPWNGLVKNRCKNGDFYWVDATVTPLKEDGQVIGYMSLRRQPERAKVEAAEALYREINAGRATLARKAGFFARLSLGNKVTLAAAAVIAGTMTLASMVVGLRTQTLLEDQSIRVVSEQMAVVRNIVDVAASQLNQEALRLNRIFAGEFPSGFAVDGPANGAETVLKHGGKVLNGQFAEVDGFTAASNAVATLFVRSGDDFYRISTSLKKEDGQRAVGTALDHGHPAYAKLLAGSGYVGKAVLFGRDVYTSYLPIKNAAGQVIGATFIGLDFTEQLKTLKDKLRSIKMGETGYVYVLDAKEGPDYGKLVVHPAKEGANLLAAKDERGREFIKELLDNKGGALRYFWKNPEAGETEAREKLVVGELFSEWNWMIAGGPYLDESHKDIRAIMGMNILSALFALSFMGFVLFWLIRRMVARPVDDVNQVLDEIAQGNYAARTGIDLQRPDEIGHLVRALTAMQTRMGFEVAETRRVADESLRLKIGLDNVATNVMLADARFDIIYMNQSLVKMFEVVEGDIRKDLPTFDRHRLIGSNIDLFHRNPAHQRGLLGRLNGTHRAEIKLGGRTFNLTVTPVVDLKGSRLGYAVEWRDRTDEVKIEGEIADIIEAAERGNLETRLDVAGLEGFFLRIGTGINGLLESNGRVMNDLGEAFRRLAEGDLTATVEQRYVGALAETVDNANRTIESLQGIIEAIKQATDAINTAAKEIASGNHDLSSRTEEQASSLEETASSMEELTSTVKQNADNARQANELAGTA